MRQLGRVFVAVGLLVAASCGGGDSDAGVDAAVAIASPEDGATVQNPFEVTMEAEGFRLEPAGAVSEGAGHFHLIVDAACVASGEEIPADETHVHLAGGERATELSLPEGEHTLCLQAGDGRHAALALTDEITITVEGRTDTTAATTTDVPPGALEVWLGDYEGEVVWDCGAAGVHRGTLEADVLIVTYGNGRAVLDAAHTVTGSCADTGRLSTPIKVEGRRTASEFRFPSTVWGRPGTLVLTVNGSRVDGTLSGAIPGPATMTIDFVLECSFGRCR